MYSADDYLKQLSIRRQQRENQNLMRDRREAEKKKKLDIRRKILIGEMVCKHFPFLLEIPLPSSEQDDSMGFADFEKVLINLSSESEFLKNLK